MTTLYDFTPKDIDGHPHPLSDYRGQVVLIVNVASRCGFTPQYAALEAMYQRYRKEGFTILAFPCNQFGEQEPGTDADIARFCHLTYDISFPLFAKVDVNGVGAIPLYTWLRNEKRGFLGTTRIKWNFTKFLVGRDGRVLGRHGTWRRPEAITHHVEAALTKPS